MHIGYISSKMNCTAVFVAMANDDGVVFTFLQQTIRIFLVTIAIIAV